MCVIIFSIVTKVNNTQGAILTFAGEIYILYAAKGLSDTAPLLHTNGEQRRSAMREYMQSAFVVLNTIAKELDGRAAHEYRRTLSAFRHCK